MLENKPRPFYEALLSKLATDVGRYTRVRVTMLRTSGGEQNLGLVTLACGLDASIANLCRFAAHVRIDDPAQLASTIVGLRGICTGLTTAPKDVRNWEEKIARVLQALSDLISILESRTKPTGRGPGRLRPVT